MVANLHDNPLSGGEPVAKQPAEGKTALSRLEKEWKLKVHDRLLKIMDLALLATIEEDIAREQIRETSRRLLEEEAAPLNVEQRRRVIKYIEDEVMGLGPLEPLLADKKVADILVNGANQVYVERRGRMELTDVKFNDDAHLLHIIDRIVSTVGRRIDESSPMVDARLKDGSRVNAIIPPLAIDGPMLSIRRFAVERLKMEELIAYGSINTAAAEVLRAVVAGRLNVLISGGTGAGKTTLLNVLSGFIPETERIVTIEDSAELQLQQPHVVRLETRPPNLEGEGEITMRDLVKNCLRMRPERIIVGEVRGPEAFDLLQAMNTGHDGSMGTLHANSPREALSRLESMITMGGYSLPSRTIREMIISSIDVVVQAARLRDGSRRITHISEVLGMEGDTIVMQDVFLYDILGEDGQGNLVGRHRSTGITKPQFTERARYFNEEANLVEALEKSNVEQREILNS
jgi:pilus assembly protein CpaF